MRDALAPHIDEHVRLAEKLRDRLPLLRTMADIIINAVDDGHTVYLLGNGGSAADAQHIAAELVGRFKRERRALPAVALTTDTSNLLAIGNDFGFGHVFTRQVEALVRPGDVVWALSTSGSSPNVIEAVQVSRAAQALILGFTGRSGGQLKSLCDHCLCVNHDQSDRIQEIHQLAYHLVCEMVEHHFAS